MRCCCARGGCSSELPEKDLSWRHNQPLCSDLRPGAIKGDSNSIIVMLLVRIVGIIVNNIIIIIIMRSLIMTSISVTIMIITTLGP